MKQKLIDLLRPHVPESIAITEASRLREDLDLNSLSMMMILWEAEQLLGVTPDIGALSTAKTVGELLHILETEE